MTNKEYAAGLLIEAAEMLAESYGQNGAARKFYDERVKNAKNKSEADKARAARDEADTRRYPKGSSMNKRAVTINRGNEGRFETQEYFDARNNGYSQPYDRLSDKSKNIHSKINKRASMHESVSFEMLEN